MPLTISNSTLLAAALGLLLAAAGASAQRYPPPDPPPLTTAPCKPTKKDPCPPPAVAPVAAPAAAFPFPGDSGQIGADPAKTPASPAAGSATTPGAFPFPGETAAPASAPAPAPGSFPFPTEPTADLPGAASASSSSSSDSSSPGTDPNQPPLKDEGSTGSTRFSRRKLPKVNVIDPDERESRDLEVSHYYFTTGNFQGAYSRAKDAIANIPDDPAAHLALAEAAARLNKPEEAAAEYAACLKLDATDPQVKAAKKGLAELAALRPKIAVR